MSVCLLKHSHMSYEVLWNRKNGTEEGLTGNLDPNSLASAQDPQLVVNPTQNQVFATGNEYLERCNGTPAFLAPEMMRPNTRYRCGTKGVGEVDQLQ